jgi:ABC-type amino acid transport substrate-binding protein
MSLGLITPGALIVGIDAAPPPPLHMGEPDSPDFSGFEVDLMAALAGDLGVTVRCRSVLWRASAIH